MTTESTIRGGGVEMSITSKVAASRPNEIVTTVLSSRNVNSGAIPDRRFPFSSTWK
jgi:hypothetical protein